VHAKEQCAFLSASIMTNGEWDGARSREILQRLGDPSDSLTNPDGARTVLDIGAHVGWFTLLVASAGHRVVAVEPMGYNLEVLRASLQLNDDMRSRMNAAEGRGANESILPFRERVRLFAGAVADESSKGVQRCVQAVGAADDPLVVGGVSNRGNGQLAVEAERGNGGGSSCREVVETSTIDELLVVDRDRENTRRNIGAEGETANTNGMLGTPPHRFPDIFMVKLDIEGWETLALKGATKLLTGGGGRHPPCLVYLEHYTSFATRTGVKAMEVFEMLVGSFGYKAFAFDNSTAVHALFPWSTRPGLTLEDIETAIRKKGGPVEFEFRHQGAHCQHVLSLPERQEQQQGQQSRQHHQLPVQLSLEFGEGGRKFPVRFTPELTGSVHELEQQAWRFCLLHGLDPTEFTASITEGMIKRTKDVGGRLQE
jgi:hypothetical protein